jgi:hypothetical protein
MKQYITLFLSFISVTVFSQELVNGGGFESSPETFQNVESVDHYYPGYSPPNHEGSAIPFAGNCFRGIRVYHGFGDYQEYIYQTFEPGEMVAGTTYKVSLMYSLNDAALHTTDDFGFAFFHVDPDPIGVNTDSIRNRFRRTVPQVRNPKGQPMTEYTGWKELSGFYTATGNEKFFAIGCFKVDSTISLYDVTTNYPTHADHTVFYIDNVSITVCPKAGYQEMSDTVFCEPGQAVLDAAYPNATYQWNTGQTTPQLQINEQAATYWVDINFGGGCTYRDYVRVSEFNQSRDLGPDITICSNKESVTLALQTTAGESIVWSTGEKTSQVTVNNSATYFVEAEHGGCHWSDSIKIHVFDDVLIYPNPSSGKIQFTQDNMVVKNISTADGKDLLAQPMNASDINSITSFLQSAVYYLEIEGSGCKNMLKLDLIR